MKKANSGNPRMAVAAPVLCLGFLIIWTVYIRANTTKEVLGESQAFLLDQQKYFLLAMVLIIAAFAAAMMWAWFRRVPAKAYICVTAILLAIGSGYQTYCGHFNAEGAFLGLMPNRAKFLVVFIAAVVGTYMVYRHLGGRLQGKLYWLLWWGILAALVINILFGKAAADGGPRLWVCGVQIGEFVKVGLILLGASSWTSNQARYEWQTREFWTPESLRRVRPALAYMILCIVATGTYVLLRDLGCAVIIYSIFLWMLYCYTDDQKLFRWAVIISAILFGVAVSLTDVGSARICNTFSMMELQGDGYRTQQGYFLRGVIFGGFTGLGGENARYFTSQFASETDAALAGVLALFGVPVFAVVVLAYIVLILKSAYASSICNQHHLILIQTSILLTVSFCLNFAGSMDAMPFSGLVAPLISSGGSSLTAMGALMGLCLAALNPRVPGKDDLWDKIAKRIGSAWRRRRGN